MKGLSSSIDVFVNRMNSNSARGRSIINDSAVQTLFATLQNMHPQLLQYLQAQEEKRCESTDYSCYICTHVISYNEAYSTVVEYFIMYFFKIHGETHVMKRFIILVLGFARFAWVVGYSDTGFYDALLGRYIKHETKSHPCTPTHSPTCNYELW